MGNYKFKFSDMIPNAWFYKLKDISRSRKLHPTKKNTSSLAFQQKPHNSLPTYTYSSSYYSSPVNLKAYDTHFPDPARRSLNTRAKRRTVYRPSPRAAPNSAASAGCRSCHSAWRTNKSILLQSPDDYTSAFESSTGSESPLSEDDSNFLDHGESHELLGSLSNSNNDMVSTSTCDIVIDMDEKSCPGSKLEKAEDASEETSEVDVTPRSAKPVTSCTKTEETRANKPPSRKFHAKSGGIKLRTSSSSPRMGNRRIQQGCSRKSISSSSRSGNIDESFVVVKSSFDPQKDFKESMAEMIVENNIRSSKDLEQLLACYLSLNSKQYHGQIVKAFEQIWFDRINKRL